MPTELDELEEFDMRADRSANPGKRLRSARKSYAAAVARGHARPKWKKQLATMKMVAAKAGKK